MSLSVVIPNNGLLPEDAGLDVMAVEAEAAGAYGLWVGGHNLLVDEKRIGGYPYAADGLFPWPATHPFYDPLVSCAWVAAATSRCRVGTAVLVLPQLAVLDVAKSAATIDRLSGGRLALGVGAGWNRAEMEALGYSFADRGSRLEEMMAVLRDCWGGAPGAFDGEHVSIGRDIRLFPRPAAEDGVPLLVGGMSMPAMRRAATLADGWLAISFADRLDVEDLRRKVSVLRELRAGAGGADLDLVLKLHSGAASTSGMARSLSALGGLFDEVIVELPWSDGVDAATGAFAAYQEAWFDR